MYSLAVSLGCFVSPNVSKLRSTKARFWFARSKITSGITSPELEFRKWPVLIVARFSSYISDRLTEPTDLNLNGPCIKLCSTLKPTKPNQMTGLRSLLRSKLNSFGSEFFGLSSRLWPARAPFRQPDNDVSDAIQSDLSSFGRLPSLK
jgi:hypothetical protein